MYRTIIAVISVVALVAASFWGGTFYQRSQLRSQFAARGFNMQGAPGQMQRWMQQGGDLRSGNHGMGGGPGGERNIFGRLDKINDDELTLTTSFGSVKVAIDDKTSINRAQEMEPDELEAGKQIIIRGTVDGDGKVTAKSVIQLK